MADRASHAGVGPICSPHSFPSTPLFPSPLTTNSLPGVLALRPLLFSILHPLQPRQAFSTSFSLSFTLLFNLSTLFSNAQCAYYQSPLFRPTHPLFTMKFTSLSLLALSATAVLGSSMPMGINAHHQHLSRRMHRIPLQLSARATSDQLAQQAALNSWNDKFHQMNTEWQAAVLAAQKDGKTPPTFDQFAATKGGMPEVQWPGATGSSAAVKPATSQIAPAAATPATNDEGDDDETCAADAQENDDEDCDGEEAAASQPPAPKKQAAPSSSKPAAAPASTGGGGDGGGGSWRSGMKIGKATFYNPSAGLTSCGKQFSDSDAIFALNVAQMTKDWSTGNNPNNNPLCGRKVKLTHNGKTKIAEIQDTCPGCQGPNAVDLSPALFKELANEQEMVMNSFTVNWEFV